MSWLDSHERSRHDRFTVVAAQRRFLLSHSFVRQVLSSYFPGLSESDWMFELGPHGRPELAEELVKRVPELAGLRFSLSHTDSLFALLLARDIDCGVDVEATTRKTDLLGVGKRSFAPSEFAIFERLTGQVQRRRFFEYWTLKESYIKAIGTGLLTPLRNFWFALDDATIAASERRIDVSFAEVHEDDPLRWTFGLSRPTPEHQLAWAVSNLNSDVAPAAIHMRQQVGARRPVLVKWLTK